MLGVAFLLECFVLDCTLISRHAFSIEFQKLCFLAFIASETYLNHILDMHVYTHVHLICIRNLFNDCTPYPGSALPLELELEFQMLYISCYIQEVSDARLIRNRILKNFELATQQATSEEERKRLLHFVIVGGGPTGVEFGAEFYDFLKEVQSIKLCQNASIISCCTGSEATFS